VGVWLCVVRPEINFILKPKKATAFLIWDCHMKGPATTLVENSHVQPEILQAPETARFSLAIQQKLEALITPWSEAWFSNS
jgi:hypothetical protein